MKGEVVTMDTWLSDTIAKERKDAEKKAEKKRENRVISQYDKRWDYFSKTSC